MYIQESQPRGRCCTCKPRYSPLLWSQYHSALQGTARTNNIPEEWHNWLQVVIGKDHSGFYTFLVELAKKTSRLRDYAVAVADGQKIQKGQDTKGKKLKKK